VNGVTNGGYGSALDVAKLFAKVYVSAPAIFENTTKSISTIGSSDGNNTAKNTNEGASHIPGLVASKTGFTDLALGNLGVVVEMGPANPVVIVVLHSSKEGRFTDVEKLRKVTLQSMR
jgi:D-alanyl-D-alanine carboxypeptidase